ncbi:hypothetical protein BofuT4_uP000060.1 [Botrytis cinerea T4]|uniref:Uncharacterized protein n=1 Tax=Botryotinia fuckeliana (strain T4) TaxID=999810 RepID=G2YLR1_BOTF4|nr:hypothetical protein BofuT4_uP000060.1 [Botrytis cinerea T4]
MPRSAQYCITLPVEIIDIRPPQLAQSPRKPIPVCGRESKFRVERMIGSLESVWWL